MKPISYNSTMWLLDKAKLGRDQHNPNNVLKTPSLLAQEVEKAPSRVPKTSTKIVKESLGQSSSTNLERSFSESSSTNV